MKNSKLDDKRNKTRGAENSSDPLFQLIQSLDKNEKGYFKKFAARYGEKNTANAYLQLFDLIEKSETYDEDKMKRQLHKGGKKINLSAQKGYLYEQIIRALRLYASGKSTNYNTLERLQDIQNLMDRGLSNQAFDLLNDTLKKAEETENLEMVLQLRMLEDAYMLRLYGRFSAEKMRAAKEAVKEALHKITVEHELSRLLFEMKLVDDSRGQEELLSDKIRNEADAIINNPILKEAETLGKRGKLQAYAIQHLYYGTVGNDEQALHYMKKRHDVYVTMELDLRTTNSYLANVSNIILTALNLGKIDEALYYLHSLEKSRFKDQALELYRKKVYAKNLLMVRMANSLNKVSPQEIAEAEAAYTATQPEPLGNNNLMSSYYLGILFFAAHGLGKALEWLNTCFEHRNTSYTNVQAYAKILSAAVHYQQGNLSLMESALQGTQYFMKKNNLTSAFLRTCMQQLQKLANVAPGEKKEQLQKFQQVITDMYNTNLSSEITYFHDFNLALWCASLLNGTTYGKELTAIGSKQTADSAAVTAKA